MEDRFNKSLYDKHEVDFFFIESSFVYTFSLRKRYKGKRSQPWTVVLVFFLFSIVKKKNGTS